MKAIVLVLFFLLSSFASDYEKYDSHYSQMQYKKKMRLKKNIQFLDLSKEQHKEIRKILISSKNEYRKYYKKKNKMERKLEDIMRSDYFDEDRYEDIIEDIYEEVAEIEAEQLKKIHRVLTPRQRGKFATRLKEWRVE